MKTTYDKKADALYISLKEGRAVRNVEPVPGLIIDIDEKGEVIGIEILNLSVKTSLSETPRFEEINTQIIRDMVFAHVLSRIFYYQISQDRETIPLEYILKALFWLIDPKAEHGMGVKLGDLIARRFGADLPLRSYKVLDKFKYPNLGFDLIIENPKGYFLFEFSKDISKYNVAGLNDRIRSAQSYLVSGKGVAFALVFPKSQFEIFNEIAASAPYELNILFLTWEDIAETLGYIIEDPSPPPFIKELVSTLINAVRSDIENVHKIPRK